MWSVVCSGTALTRQQFFQVVCELPWGFIDAENFGKLFLSSFVMGFFAGNSNLGRENSGRMECRNALSISVESDKVVTIPMSAQGR